MTTPLNIRNAVAYDIAEELGYAAVHIANKYNAHNVMYQDIAGLGVRIANMLSDSRLFVALTKYGVWIDPYYSGLLRRIPSGDTPIYKIECRDAQHYDVHQVTLS